MPATYIAHFDGSGSGLRVAVKDNIDIADAETTAGSRAVSSLGRVATRDARCLTGIRKAGVNIVGKTNLHELAVFATGINSWFGTPTNPLDPERIPGGSSSGSAVAVAEGSADIALGTDTGGSIRIPAACCGVSGLKTTYGRIPLEGVWPLAPSLDTVGVLAKTTQGLSTAMSLLDASFDGNVPPASRVGRIETNGDPRIESSVDQLLLASGLDVKQLQLPAWSEAAEAFTVIFYSELWMSNHQLLEAQAVEHLGGDVRQAIMRGRGSLASLPGARRWATEWAAQMSLLFQSVDVLVLPTIPIFAPRLDEVVGNASRVITTLTKYTLPFNLAGIPALSISIPGNGYRLPASIQLVARAGEEALLLSTGRLLETCVAS